MSRIRNCILGTLIFALSATVSLAAGLEVFPKDVYKEGVTGEDVKLLQQSLKIAGTFNEMELTDYYGTKTKEAVAAFQEANALDVDGVAGKATLQKLIDLGNLPQLSESLYKPGMEHHDIRILQGILHTAGYYTAGDFSDQFNDETKQAVVAFQEANGLEADGIVGSQSIAKMESLGYLLMDTVEAPAPQNTPTVSRGTSQRFGEYIAWSDARKLLPVGTKVTIQDFYTGRTFNLYVGYGTLHADVEPLTPQDTDTMLEIWGEFSWARRPVLVYYGDRVLAASLNFMPHAGREDKPALEYVSGRSSGFGSGKNYDLVKGNDVSGVMCLHFNGSRVHANNALDAKHQANVKIAAGLQ